MRSPNLHAADPGGIIRSLVHLLRAAYRPLLFFNGRDITQQSGRRSCLVIAPHPDDETLGCGVTIMRKVRAGAKVQVVIAADGRYFPSSQLISPDQMAQIRRAEATRACEILGLSSDSVRFLEFEDKGLTREFGALVQRLEEVITDLKPDEILAPSILDPQKDHRALSRALRAAVEIKKWDGCLSEYPIWLWASWPRVHQATNWYSRAWHFLWDPVPTLIKLRPDLVSTEGYLCQKRRALSEYKSQTVNLTGERSWSTLSETFIANFLQDYEVFFPVRKPHRKQTS
jgi:LmbE family N-acetylglucosaminyl deacetylase